MEKDIIKKEFIMYTDENNDVKVEVMLINDNLWLTQDLIADLFGKARNTISGHIKNIFEEGELDEKSNVEKIDIPNSDKYIEDLVERENTFTMQEFATSINEFLEFRKYNILKDNGKISRIQAEEKAEKEYIEFNKTQKINSDFDKLLLESKKISKK